MNVITSPIVETIVGGSMGAQGIQGIPGPPNASPSLIAGQNLSGHRAVTIDSSGYVIYADNSTLTNVIGLTTNSAITGQSLFITINGGIIEEPSWSWTTQQSIYLSNTGLLTQIAPVSGYILQLGIALSPTKMLVDIKIPISVI